MAARGWEARRRRRPGRDRCFSQRAGQPLLDNASAFTLSCWFKADNFNANSALLAKRVSDTSQNAYAILFGSGTNGGRFRIDINSNNDRFSSNTVFSTGTWYHIALVFDGTLPTAERAKLYVNGALDITVAESSTTVINSTAPLLIGRPSETDTNLFNGMMDAVRFHRRALSAAEIAGLANESAVAAPIVSAGRRARHRHASRGPASRAALPTAAAPRPSPLGARSAAPAA